MTAAPEPHITAVVSVRPSGKRPKDPRAGVEIALVYDLAVRFRLDEPRP